MGLFSSSGNEIKIRSEIKSNPNAYECLRVWMNQGAPEIFADTIKETPDPRAWGSVLADVAAFTSSHYHNGKEDGRIEALKQIQSMFNHLIDGWTTSH
ncbi:DUF5076 domain-containing protein [Flagellimonas myxillae]|uniref:DUF5076 domain-containing protein n=1 Tax=Flagellimonas myxillae TaxID=2942214 RepID=UPI00201EB948|nr:DUF5076 domain-containing protein [Muricauda myxillae]MCL6267183.1 DUF5076 domain-containing protein [Muricauda myxillae]